MKVFISEIFFGSSIYTLDYTSHCLRVIAGDQKASPWQRGWGESWPLCLRMHGRRFKSWFTPSLGNFVIRHSSVVCSSLLFVLFYFCFLCLYFEPCSHRWCDLLPRDLGEMHRFYSPPIGVLALPCTGYITLALKLAIWLAISCV